MPLGPLPATIGAASHRKDHLSMNHIRTPLLVTASLLAAALAAGCSSSSSAPAKSAAQPALRHGGGDSEGAVNSPAGVLQALQREGFHVRLYRVSGSEPRRSFAARGCR
jgi:hypothetical protein